MIAGPDDAMIGRDLDHGYSCCSPMAADDSVSAGQPLRAAGILELIVDVGVINLPDNPAGRIKLHDFIAVCE